MLKKIVFVTLLTLLTCGVSFGQTNPGYKEIAATTAGVPLVLNPDFTVAMAGKYHFEIVSTTGAWGASFWRYDPYNPGANADGFYNVGFKTSRAGSDSLSAKTNVIWPGDLQCDFVLVKGIGGTQTVDVYWYDQ